MDVRLGGHRPGDGGDNHCGTHQTDDGRYKVNYSDGLLGDWPVAELAAFLLD